MGSASSKGDSAREKRTALCGGGPRKVSPLNLAYWLGSKRLIVMGDPPAYSPSPSGPCAQPRASAPPATREELSSQPEAKLPQAPAPPVVAPTLEEALRSVAEDTLEVPPPRWNFTCEWNGAQHLLFKRAKVLLSRDKGTLHDKPESWADVIQVWAWLYLGKHAKDADRLLANFGLEDNESFMLLLAATKPVGRSR